MEQKSIIVDYNTLFVLDRKINISSGLNKTFNLTKIIKVALLQHMKDDLMDSNDIVSNIINEIYFYLKTINKFEQFFKSDIKSLDYLRQVSLEGKVRVGLIGITSSGKSTLINALLGERLLPQKVKPSSSVLVVCSYNKIKKATIYFESSANKKPQTITRNVTKN